MLVVDRYPPSPGSNSTALRADGGTGGQGGIGRSNGTGVGGGTGGEGGPGGAGACAPRA
jgi:hypothetical protein